MTKAILYGLLGVLLNHMGYGVLDHPTEFFLVLGLVMVIDYLD